MEAVSGGVVEGVVELVSRLVNSAWSKESLEEDRRESLAVRLRADPSTPAGARVDHVGVGSHVLGVQPPVPAAGERHLRPEAECFTLIGPDLSRYCALIGGIPWTMVKTSLCLSMCFYGMIRCPCTERIPYVMKTLQRQKMPLVHSRGFGFLELCLYGIRELAGMSNM